MMVKLTFIFLFFAIAGITKAQVVVAPNNPEGTFPYQFINYGLQNSGYYFLTTVKMFSTPQSPNYISPYPSIIDHNGYLVWYAKPSALNLNEFDYNEQTDGYSFAKVIQSGGMQIKFVSLDDQLNLIEDFDAINYKEDAHELSLASNGNWLYLIEILDTVDLSSEIINGQPGNSETILKGIGIQEITSTGTVVFEWNPNNFINPMDSYTSTYGYNPNSFDYCHANAIAEDTDGNLLISMRHLNAIYKINRQTGNVMWVLGGESSDFTWINDDGFSGQHNIRVLGVNNYSLFDNGNMSNPQITRGLEFTVDTISWSATMNREIIHPQNNYTPAMGSAHITEFDEAIIGYGLSYLPAPRMAHFDAQNNLLAELYFQDSIVSYRVNYSPSISNLNRPEISCNFNGTSWELSAPAGHASYWWSNGETTQNIVITEQDTLQVFVPQGIGFISSEAISVNPNSNPCSLSTHELILNNGSGSFDWYDLMGQKVLILSPNAMYFKVWENGYVERIFVAE